MEYPNLTITPHLEKALELPAEWQSHSKIKEWKERFPNVVLKHNTIDSDTLVVEVFSRHTEPRFLGCIHKPYDFIGYLAEAYVGFDEKDKDENEPEESNKEIWNKYYLFD